MDWYPLWNSLRIAAISTVIIFFAGIFAAYYIAKLPRLVKGVLDVLLTLPLVLPPTVVGYFILLLMGALLQVQEKAEQDEEIVSVNISVTSFCRSIAEASAPVVWVRLVVY